MSLHTPGPWSPLDPKWSSLIIAGDADHPVAEVRGWGWLQKKGHTGAAEQDANLHLLAASPDMLAALKLCRQHMYDHASNTPDRAFELLVAAIEKAEKQS